MFHNNFNRFQQNSFFCCNLVTTSKFRGDFYLDITKNVPVPKKLFAFGKFHCSTSIATKSLDTQYQ